MVWLTKQPPRTPDQTGVGLAQHSAGRLISSWETSGKAGRGQVCQRRQGRGKKHHYFFLFLLFLPAGSEKLTAEVTSLRGNTRKSPGSLGQGLPRTRQPVWDTAHPCATHRGDSLGGLALINANSSALWHFSSLASVLGFNTHRGTLL